MTAMKTAASPTGRGARRGSSVAPQVRAQRRGYAAAVLRSVAKSHAGRPAPQVRAVLHQSLTPLGVRLPPAALQALALKIAAGHLVHLP